MDKDEMLAFAEKVGKGIKSEEDLYEFTSMLSKATTMAPAGGMSNRLCLGSVLLISVMTQRIAAHDIVRDKNSGNDSNERSRSEKMMDQLAFF